MRDYKKYAQDLRRIAQFQNCFECYEGERTEGSCSSYCTLNKAADAIEELLARDVVPTDFHERCLQSEIKKRLELEKQVPTWISVDDALPKPESMVLVATKYGGVYYGFLNHSGKFYTANNTLYDSWCWEPDVTHWMPLPKAPEPTNGGNHDN